METQTFRAILRAKLKGCVQIVLPPGFKTFPQKSSYDLGIMQVKLSSSCDQRLKHWDVSGAYGVDKASLSGGH